MKTEPNDIIFDPMGGTNVGLTKREYLSGLAMQGLLSSITINALPISAKIQMAVECADSLIIELNK